MSKLYPNLIFHPHGPLQPPNTLPHLPRPVETLLIPLENGKEWKPSRKLGSVNWVLVGEQQGPP